MNRKQITIIQHQDPEKRDNIHNLLKVIQTEKNTDVLVLAQFECKLSGGSLKEYMVGPLEDALQHNNNTLKVVLGSFDPRKFPEFKEFSNKILTFQSDKIQCEYYPGLLNVLYAHGHVRTVIQRYPLPDFDTLSHTFCCLNWRKHPHRSYNIDLLSKHNLIENNLVSWRKIQKETAFDGYDFEYFTERSIILPEYDLGFNRNQREVQAQEIMNYHSILFDYVIETSVIEPFITEKTLRPILAEKPFVCLASVRFFDYLTDMGYLTFPEIFNYDFDKEIDWQKRANMIVEQIAHIDRHRDEIYHDHKKIIREKTRHNLEIFIQNLFDFTIQHKVLADYCKLDDVKEAYRKHPYLGQFTPT